MGREDEVRLIAYNIWEEEGCVDGHDCDHWLRAELIWEQQKQKAGTKLSQEVSGKAKQTVKAKGKKIS